MNISLRLENISAGREAGDILTSTQGGGKRSETCVTFNYCGVLFVIDIKISRFSSTVFSLQTRPIKFIQQTMSIPTNISKGIRILQP